MVRGSMSTYLAQMTSCTPGVRRLIYSVYGRVADQDRIVPRINILDTKYHFKLSSTFCELRVVEVLLVSSLLIYAHFVKILYPSRYF